MSFLLRKTPFTKKNKTIPLGNYEANIYNEELYLPRIYDKKDFPNGYDFPTGFLPLKQIKEKYGPDAFVYTLDVTPEVLLDIERKEKDGTVHKLVFHPEFESPTHYPKYMSDPVFVSQKKLPTLFLSKKKQETDKLKGLYARESVIEANLKGREQKERERKEISNKEKEEKIRREKEHEKFLSEVMAGYKGGKHKHTRKQRKSTRRRCHTRKH